MTIVWKNHWNTGLEAIDQQHHRISEYINKLGKLVPEEGSSPLPDHDHDAEEFAHYACLFESISSHEFNFVLDELIACIEEHFSFEEELHLKTHYLLSDTHKETHDVFLARIKKYQTKLNDGENVASKIYRILYGWMEQHIQYDQHYADIMKRKMGNSRLSSIVEDQEKESGWLTRSLKAITKRRSHPSHH